MQDGAPESEQPALHEHEALPPIGSPDPERAEPDGVVQDALAGAETLSVFFPASTSSQQRLHLPQRGHTAMIPNT